MVTQSIFDLSSLYWSVEIKQEPKQILLVLEMLTVKWRERDEQTNKCNKVINMPHSVIL